MKYHISREQRFFFDESHFIEFDELLSQQEHRDLVKEVSRAKEGRDLSRENSTIKKIVQHPRLAKLTAELVLAKTLRFGFDQVIGYPWAFTNLSQEACISGLIAGLILPLEDEKLSGIIFKPTLDLSTLNLDPAKKYLLVAYVDRSAQYLFQPKDPYTHTLKKLGLVFGDLLPEKLHPTLVR